MDDLLENQQTATNGFPTFESLYGGQNAYRQMYARANSPYGFAPEADRIDSAMRQGMGYGAQNGMNVMDPYAQQPMGRNMPMQDTMMQAPMQMPMQQPTVPTQDPYMDNRNVANGFTGQYNNARNDRLNMDQAFTPAFSNAAVSEEKSLKVKNAEGTRRKGRLNLKGKLILCAYVGFVIVIASLIIAYAGRINAGKATVPSSNKAAVVAVESHNSNALQIDSRYEVKF